MLMIDTRKHILEKNYEFMHLYGFQGLRTDKVIAELSITKGAFYHYFKNKKSVGYAIVDEILYPHYTAAWSDLLKNDKHVIDNICDTIETISNYSNPQNIHLGCPLNNLVQEMSPLDEGFRVRLLKIIEKEKALITEALLVAKKEKMLTADAEPEILSVYILASLEGSFTMGKSFQDFKVFKNCINQLKNSLLKYKN